MACTDVDVTDGGRQKKRPYWRDGGLREKACSWQPCAGSWAVSRSGSFACTALRSIWWRLNSSPVRPALPCHLAVRYTQRLPIEVACLVPGAGGAYDTETSEQD
jgi:hypothetical protein